MSYTWITPKTDWDSTTKFAYTDYNRIRNNLLYINDMLNEMYPDKAVELDLGEAKTGYTNSYEVARFNAFEDALESFTRIGQDVNIGKRNYYHGNDVFIWADALNRLEECCIRWKTKTENVVTQIIAEYDNWQIPYWRYSYQTITLTPSNATNINDLYINKVTYNGETHAYGDKYITPSIENGKLKVWAQNIVDAEIELKCGEVTKTIYVTVLNTATGIHLATVKNGQSHLASFGLSLKRHDVASYYVTTSPTDAIDKNEYGYVLSDNSIVSVTRNGDILTFEPLKVGKTVLTLYIGNITSNTPTEITVIA